MPNKNFTYNVRIKASLDSSKLTGAGSSVSRQVEQEFEQRQDSSNRRQEAKEKASLEKRGAIYQDSNRKKAQWMDEEAAAWQTSRGKMDRADETFTSKQLKRRQKFYSDITNADKEWSDSEHKSWKRRVQQDKDWQKFGEETHKQQETLRQKAYKAIETHERKLDSLYNRPRETSKLNRQISAGGFAGLDDKTLGELQKKAAEVDSVMSQSGKSGASSFWGSFRGAFIGILTGIAIGTVLQAAQAVGTQIVMAIAKGMELQQLKVGLASVSTSAVEANERVSILEQTAKNTPGLGFENAVEGQMRLQAVGFTAQETTGMLVGLSKVKMLSNATEEDYRAVILNLSQIKSLGKLTGDEIRETLGRMPAMASVFRKAFGTVDINQIRALDLTSYEFFKKFNAALATVPTRAETAASAFTKLQNSWTIAQGALADPVLDPLKDFFVSLSIAIDKNRDMFDAWGRSLGKALNGLSALTSPAMLKTIGQLGEILFRMSGFGAVYNVVESIGNYVGPPKNPQSAAVAPEVRKRSVAEQLAQTTEIDQKIRILDEATRDRTQEMLSLSERSLRDRKLNVTEFAGFSTAAESRLSLELLEIERERISNAFEIEAQGKIQQIILAGDDIAAKKELEKDFTNWLLLHKRTTAAELLDIDRKTRKQQIADEDRNNAQRRVFLDAQYEESQVGNRQALAAADTSTPGRAASAARGNFKQNERDLLQGLKKAEETYYEKIRTRAVNGSISADDLNEAAAALATEQTNLTKQLATLRGTYAATERDNIRQLKQAALYGGDLKITTNDQVMDSIIKSIAGKYGVNPTFLSAITNYETRDRSDGTNFKSMDRRNAMTSPDNGKGRGSAKGAFQQLDSFATQYNVSDSRNFSDAAGGAARWLKQAIEYYKDQPDALELIASAYNGGTSMPKGAKAKAEQVKFLRGLMKRDRQNGDYSRKVAGLVRGGVDAGADVSFGTTDFGQLSDDATADYSNKQTLDLIAYYKANKLTPDDNLLSKANAIAVAQARQTGKRQPTLRETAGEFGSQVTVITPKMYAAGRDEDTESGYQSLDNRKRGFGREVERAKRLQDIARGNEMLDLKKQYALIKNIAVLEEKQLKVQRMKNEDAQAELDYATRELSIQEEIEFAVKAQARQQKNELLDIKKEFTLLTSINLEEEAKIATGKKQNDLQKMANALVVRQLRTQKEISEEIEMQAYKMQNDILDVMRDMAVLEQQNADATAVMDRRNLAALTERFGLEKELASISDEMANSGINDELTLRVELLKQQRDIQKEGLEAVITARKAEVEINRVLDIRGDKIYAKIIGHLANQTTLNDAIADGVISIYEGAAGGLDKLIDKGTKNLGIFQGFVGGIAKTLGRSVLTNVARDVLGKFGLGGIVDKVQESSNPVVAGLQKQDQQIDLLKQIRDNTGGVGGIGIGGSGGSLLSGGKPNFGNILKAFLGGGGGNGPGGTPLFNGGAGSGLDLGLLAGAGGFNAGLGNTGSLPGVLGSPSNKGGFFGGLSNLLTGGKGFASLKGGFASILPMLGLGLGSSVGGGSGLSGILGGLGGLALGGAGAVGLLGGAGAATFAAGGTLSALGPLAAFLSNPFTIAAGGALLIGAYFLNRNKQRRAAEQQRSAIIGDSFTQLDAIIGELRGRRISGPEALSQAESIKSQYIQQVSQIKDKKTRNIALNELNPPNRFWAKMEDIKKEAEIAGVADEREKQILPEFATGGLVGGVLDLTNFRRRNGRVPGDASRGDVVPSLLTADEMVLNQAQQNKVKMIAGPDVFHAAQIPGYADGRAPVSSTSTTAAPTYAAPQFTFNVSQELDANNMVRIAISSDNVKPELVRVVNKGILDNSIKTKQ